MPEVDALTLVLEADPSNFEQGMDRAEQSADEFKQTQENVELQNLQTMAALEGLTSGLNGLVGGYSKTINAAKDLGMVNERQYEDMLALQKQFELIAGPMEMVISGMKLMNAVMLMNPVILIVVAIIALIAVLIYLEIKFGVITNAVESMNDVFDAWKEKVDNIKDSIDGLLSKADAITDIGDRITGLGSYLGF